MWYPVRQNIVMQARCDYILGTDRCRFKMVGIRGVSNNPSYHFALQDRLLIFTMETGHHCGTGGLPAQMGAVHEGIEEAGS